MNIGVVLYLKIRRRLRIFWFQAVKAGLQQLQQQNPEAQPVNNPIQLVEAGLQQPQQQNPPVLLQVQAPIQLPIQAQT